VDHQRRQSHAFGSYGLQPNRLRGAREGKKCLKLLGKQKTPNINKEIKIHIFNCYLNFAIIFKMIDLFLKL
jgi:hypothetical protein